MYGHLVEKSLNTSSRSKPVETPNNNISSEEAKKLLLSQYKDLVSVTKAMQMLGNKSTVTPKVRTARILRNFMSKFTGYLFIGLQETNARYTQTDVRIESQSSTSRFRTS